MQEVITGVDEQLHARMDELANRRDLSVVFVDALFKSCHLLNGPLGVAVTAVRRSSALAQLGQHLLHDLPDGLFVGLDHERTLSQS